MFGRSETLILAASAPSAESCLVPRAKPDRGALQYFRGSLPQHPHHLSIGPSRISEMLGNRVDLVFHIGVLLKRFEQEEVMRRMIEAAQRQYPDSPEVAKAAQHLLA